MKNLKLLEGYNYLLVLLCWLSSYFLEEWKGV